MFRSCPRCKEPIYKTDYDRHIAEKMCIPWKAENVANRCPLCHIDITPPGHLGWKLHLQTNGCPNNPRTNN